MDTTTATPVEIDTQLADIYRRAGQAEGHAQAAATNLHYALGERARYVTRSRREWPTTTAEALTACRARGDQRTNFAGGYTFADMAARYDGAVATLAAIEAEADVLNAEFKRRGGWTRFFTVQQHNGHIHADMNCSTCNRGGVPTSFGWNPELSGLTMADAIAHFDRNAYQLCTVCFPDAPVEDRPAPLTREQKAAAKAKAEAAARVNDPKLIAAPDGGPLRVDGTTLRTVRTAQIAMVNHLFWALYSVRHGSGNGDTERTHARQVAEALAVKNGEQVDDILAAAEVKASKKFR